MEERTPEERNLIEITKDEGGFGINYLELITVLFLLEASKSLLDGKLFLFYNRESSERGRSAVFESETSQDVSRTRVDRRGNGPTSAQCVLGLDRHGIQSLVGLPES